MIATARLSLGHLVRTLAAAFPVAPGQTWTATVEVLGVAPLALELVA